MMAAVNSGAMGALRLEEDGRHAEALSGAKALVNQHRTSAKAHNLLGYLHRQAAARADGDLLKRQQHNEEACKAYARAAHLVPNCIVTGIALAEAFIDSKQYPDAMSALRRVKQIGEPTDPGAHYIGAEKNKFCRNKGNTKKERVQSSWDMGLLMVPELQGSIEIEIVPMEAKELLKLSSDEPVAALERGNVLAKEWPSSGRAQLLLAHLQRQHDLAVNQGSDNAAALYNTLSTIQDLVYKFPRSLVIALYEAQLLAELDEPASVVKCRQAFSMEDPEDPILHDLTLGDFEGNDKEERISAARLKLQALHDKVITEAVSFWHSFGRKEAVTNVSVDALEEHFAPNEEQQYSKTIHEACSFFKKHQQWSYYLGTSCNICMDVSSLQLDWGFKLLDWGFEQESEIFEAILGGHVYTSDVNNSHLDGITYAQDPQQNDIFHLPDVEYMLGSMLSQSEAPLVSEVQMLAMKAGRELEIFPKVQEELKTLCGLMGSPQYEESCGKIRNLWVQVLEAMHFDYREILIPLIHKFQWLKQCMANAKNRQLLQDSVCSRCWDWRHTTTECTLCIVCSSDTHSSPDCPVLKQPGPVAQLVGCATPGQEFYVSSLSRRHVTALVTVESGTITVEQLVEEFNQMFDQEWKWAAREYGQHTFLMKFPDMARIEALSTSTLTLKNSGAQIRISKRQNVVKPKGRLPLVWVEVKGVPDDKKDYQSLQEIGSMIGSVQFVDMELLEGYDIVRMKVFVNDHNKIPLYTKYVVEGEIYYIYFSLDSVIDPGYISEDRNDNVNLKRDNTSGVGPESGSKSVDNKIDEVKNVVQEGASNAKDEMAPVPGGPEESGGKLSSLQSQGVVPQKHYKKDAVPHRMSIRPSTLYGLGRLRTGMKEKSPQPEHEYIVLGKVVPQHEVKLFAHHCKAAERCRSTHTICHICSMEGVADLQIQLSKVSIELQQKVIYYHGLCQANTCTWQNRSHIFTFLFDTVRVYVYVAHGPSVQAHIGLVVQLTIYPPYLGLEESSNYSPLTWYQVRFPPPQPPSRCRRRPWPDDRRRRSPRPRSSTATTSAPCTSPPTRFSTNARSMWRSTSTLFVTGLLSAMFGFSMSRPPPNLLTSSPRVFPRRCSRSFAPAST